MRSRDTTGLATLNSLTVQTGTATLPALRLGTGTALGTGTGMMVGGNILQNVQQTVSGTLTLPQSGSYIEFQFGNIVMTLPDPTLAVNQGCWYCFRMPAAVAGG